jgi:hypothetical protein
MPEHPPTQLLILEVLAARFRLGEPYWTFPLKLRPALGALQDKGLIWTRSAPTPDLQAYLTDAGKAEVLLETYESPAVRDHEDLLASIWLYIKWHYVTRQLTTPQKDLFANSVDRSHERNHDGLGPISEAERWWRE